MAALDMFLFRTKSVMSMRAKMMVLERRMASRKDHLTLERLEVARLVKMRAGRENFPDDIGIIMIWF